MRMFRCARRTAALAILLVSCTGEKSAPSEPFAPEDEAAVRASFAAFKEATLNGDGATAASLVLPSAEMFAEVARLALHAPRAVLERKNLTIRYSDR